MLRNCRNSEPNSGSNLSTDTDIWSIKQIQTVALGYNSTVYNSLNSLKGLVLSSTGNFYYRRVFLGK